MLAFCAQLWWQAICQHSNESTITYCLKKIHINTYIWCARAIINISGGVTVALLFHRCKPTQELMCKGVKFFDISYSTFMREVVKTLTWQQRSRASLFLPSTLWLSFWTTVSRLADIFIVCMEIEMYVSVSPCSLFQSDSLLLSLLFSLLFYFILPLLMSISLAFLFHFPSLIFPLSHSPLSFSISFFCLHSIFLSFSYSNFPCLFLLPAVSSWRVGLKVRELYDWNIKSSKQD